MLLTHMLSIREMSAAMGRPLDGFHLEMRTILGGKIMVFAN